MNQMMRAALAVEIISLEARLASTEGMLKEFPDWEELKLEHWVTYSQTLRLKELYAKKTRSKKRRTT